MSEPKRNCLWCAYCCQIDDGWYHCSERNAEFSHARASAWRKCPMYSPSWCRADNIEDTSDRHAAERERALYERRMRGDWS